MTFKNNVFQSLFILFLFCQSLQFALAVAAPNDKADQSLSPYFHIEGERPETETFPLESTEVVANIAGVIADVCVRQTYRNEGKTPIEAIYVFPASTRAAVSRFDHENRQSNHYSRYSRTLQSPQKLRKSQTTGQTSHTFWSRNDPMFFRCE